MAGTAISFNSNSLQTDNIITQDIPHFGASGKRATPYTISHANKSVIPFIEYPNKVIPVGGQIVGTSVSDLDTQIDIFNGYMLAENANLDIGYAGSTRRYVSTPTSINITRPNGLLVANFTVQFVCTEAFGKDTAVTTAISASGRTMALYDDSYTFEGTAPYQLPVITVTYSAVGDVTSKSVSISNNDTGQTITVTRIFTAGDVLQVVASTGKVTVNGTEVEFSGAFPVFVPGAGTVGYSDGFSTRTFDYDVSYTKRYQ